jgi:uncharacterized protein YbjT (DUF2867 family)
MAQYLITGATGGLGGIILSHLLAKLPSSGVIASSSRPGAESQFTSKGILFRHADYDSPETLLKAFRGVDKLFFVSSNTYDNEKRTIQHRNVVEAAKAAGVGHVYYSSLAYGGYGSDSKIAVQAAHLDTEELLRDSGISFTSVREGVYADAFPLFIDWYPDTTEILLPADGPVALASREELGEATANLMMSGEYDDKEIVLLSGPVAYTMSQVVDIVNETTGRNLAVRRVSPEEYLSAKGNDIGGKPMAFFRSRISWYEGIEKGDGATTSQTLASLLGREPLTGKQAIEALLKEAGGNYTWHQNYSNRS